MQAIQFNGVHCVAQVTYLIPSLKGIKPTPLIVLLYCWFTLINYFNNRIHLHVQKCLLHSTDNLSVQKYPLCSTSNLSSSLPKRHQAIFFCFFAPLSPYPFLFWQLCTYNCFLFYFVQIRCGFCLPRACTWITVIITWCFWKLQSYIFYGT